MCLVMPTAPVHAVALSALHQPCIMHVTHSMVPRAFQLSIVAALLFCKPSHSCMHASDNHHQIAVLLTKAASWQLMLLCTPSPLAPHSSQTIITSALHNLMPSMYATV